MKVKLLIAAFALTALAVSASAQQDPLDLGAPDSLIAVFGGYPDVAGGDSIVTIDIIFSVDNPVGSSSAALAWDFAGFEMDSATLTTEGAALFSLFFIPWRNSNLDSTNHYNHFQVTGFGVTGGLSSRAHVATYWGHVTSWTDGDEINITTSDFVTTNFTAYPSGNEWLPIWGGDAYIADVTSLGGDNLPTKFDLAQNYPNPFNPSTIIIFDLPKAAKTNLTIFNVLGQKVATLVDEELAADSYQVEWNGTSDGGNHVASGIYFYRLSAGEKIMTKKMMMLK